MIPANGITPARLILTLTTLLSLTLSQATVSGQQITGPGQITGTGQITGYYHLRCSPRTGQCRITAYGHGVPVIPVYHNAFLYGPEVRPFIRRWGSIAPPVWQVSPVPVTPGNPFYGNPYYYSGWSY